MRALLCCFLLFVSTGAFSQEVRYFSKHFQTVQPTRTPFERRYFAEQNKLRIEDYEHGTLKQKSLVEGTVLLPEVDAYLWYVKNPAEYYQKPFFANLKATIGRFTQDGKPAHEAYAYGTTIRYGQVWNEANTPVLVKGTGAHVYWAQNKTEQAHFVYQDSVMVSSFILRKQQEDTLYLTLDKMPSPKNGLAAFRNELASRIQYPEEALNAELETTVYIQFTVDEKGRLRDFKTLEGQGSGFDKNAIKKLEAYPAWEPALLRGRAVKTRHTIPIVFRLE
ncbi:energy transducer TonB [Rufibacter psychrotolerans]|uniref:energy transducer TonB n=1 Tax=Rufibacter psychrotolerans TaxID=2812556 RepID=UPI00196765FA|nr:energy transducer TonB [Rufibacter sp. SYSU D00308]